MIQEKLKTFFNVPFICQERNIRFYADSKDDADKIRDKFDLYKNSSEGSFLSNYRSEVNLRKNGFGVDCYGKVHRPGIVGGVKWSTIEIIFAIIAVVAIYNFSSYFIK